MSSTPPTMPDCKLDVTGVSAPSPCSPSRIHIDLFSGLGGFALAAAANNVTTQIFCEQNENCRSFLTDAWKLPIVRDVRTFDGKRWKGCWLLTAGVPCQPASRAGKQRGERDDRWLWPEAIRVTEESKPTWTLFENPDGIKDVGLDGVLSELERIGYEVGTLEIPACGVNAPQLRNRVWIVGHSKSLNGGLQLQPWRQNKAGPKSARTSKNGAMADHDGCGCRRMQKSPETEPNKNWKDGRLPVRNSWDNCELVACGDGKHRRYQPGICGVADGVSKELLEALGNSIVWLVASEIIGAMITSETWMENNDQAQAQPPDGNA